MSESTKPTVILYAFARPPKTPSKSSYCQKLEAFLKLNSTPYELRPAIPFNAPKGKLPYVEIYHPPTNPNPKVLADSHFIIHHLIAEGISGDVNQLAGLTKVQKAESRAWQAYIEETLSPSMVYERWYGDKNFDTFVAEEFGSVPWLIRPAVAWYLRRVSRNGLWGQGIGRHSMEEVKILQEEAVEVLDARLEGRVYFHGDEKPSEIDLILYGSLVSAIATEANPQLKELILKSPVLVAFVKRLTKSLFPEYDGLLHVLESAEGKWGSQ
jgi:Glutathione S-transferase N-terminal domain/Glutathione S-transferase, C-terminal domain